MKLEVCLLACDLNEDYLCLYRIVTKCWKNKVNISTKLILISDSIPSSLQEYSENIILFHPIENIPTAFQAQVIRILYPCLFTEISGGIIISDMDLVPLNTSFYNVDAYTSDKFIVFRDVISEYRQYPICFCAATSRTWRDIFQIHSVPDIIKTMKSWYYSMINLGEFYQISSPYSKIWACDQLQLFDFLNKWEKKETNLIKLTDEITKFQRLDRQNIEDIERNQHIFRQKIRLGEFSDFHLPRNTKYETLLQFLLDV